VVPAATPISRALEGHAGLAHLTEMARAAQSRLATIKKALPPSIHPSLSAGAVDAEGWTLLVNSAAAAAKLRQFQPQLQALLLARFGPGLLRIKRNI
jgi:hypothetical protein